MRTAARWSRRDCRVVSPLAMAQHVLVEHHFPQTRIGRAYWINFGRQNSFAEVSPAGASVAEHELESRLDGIAAAVMEASGRIDEQHRAARIAEFQNVFSIRGGVNFLVADAVASSAAPVSHCLGRFLCS